jgi:sugar transferase (PEP-CTERM/EpsH1 system associated)
MNPKSSRLHSLSGLISGKALTLPYYKNKTLQNWVDRLMSDLCVEKVVVFSSAMAQYVEKFEQALRIMDFVDVDSDKWTLYAKSKAWPLDQVYRREGRLLGRYERKIAGEFDASFFVSPQEAALFRTLAPESATRIHTYSNGVDADYFSPDRPYPAPFPSTEQAIVFTGAMDYWPNIDAVNWFARDIFPLVLIEKPDARFYIVGSNPSGAVTQLANRPGIVVTGRVDDVRPYLAHAILAVAPLRIARGIQNKVLEAMSMGTPVVASPQALEGIASTGGCRSGRDAEEFAAHILELLRSERSTGSAGRACILQHYDWDRNLAHLSSHLDHPFNTEGTS